MLRNTHRYLKSLWSGPQPDESKSLLSAAPLTYLSVEEKKPPTNRELFEKNKKMVEGKRRSFEAEQKIDRVHGLFFMGVFIVMAADPVYRSFYAYHAAWGAISDRIKNGVMPVWSSLTPSCLAGVEKELEITSPEQCFHWFVSLGFSPLSWKEVRKYEWPCEWRIADLDWKCHIDSPSFLGEFTWAFLWKVIKEELLLLGLLFAGHYLMYRLEGRYQKKYLLCQEEIKSIDDFILTEQLASGNYFRFANGASTTLPQICEMFDAIQWSYEEVDAYKEHLENVRKYLVSKFSECPAKIITEYLDDLDAMRAQAAQYCEALPERQLTRYAIGPWKNTYANFFRAVTGQKDEQDVVVEVPANHRLEAKPA